MKEVTAATWDSEVSKQPLVIVDFYATWCPPCKVVKPMLQALSEVLTSIQFCAFNIEEDSDTAEKHNVEAVPTLVIFKNGVEVDRKLGAQPKKVLEEWLRSHMA